MATIAQILSKQWPGTEWSIRGDDYSTLQWMETNTTSKPTEVEIRSYDEQVSLELRWDITRKQRDKLLLECDWTQLTDSPFDAAKIAEWVTYRQQLRDIPQQVDENGDAIDPDAVVWPTKPS